MQLNYSYRPFLRRKHGSVMLLTAALQAEFRHREGCAEPAENSTSLSGRQPAPSSQRDDGEELTTVMAAAAVDSTPIAAKVPCGIPPGSSGGADNMGGSDGGFDDGD